MGATLVDPPRLGREILLEQRRQFLGNPCARFLMDAVGGNLLILNGQCQILAANSELRRTLGRQEDEDLLGLRLGEVFHCDHAREATQGCCTSGQCTYCGAFQALTKACRELRPAISECRLMMRQKARLEAAEFQVRVAPLHFGEETLLAMVLLDISGQKRKEVFERLFIHDLANSLQCLEGWSERLEAGILDPERAYTAMASLVHRLSGQLKLHQILTQAERGELQLRFDPLAVSKVLDALREQFQQHQLVRERDLVISVPSQETTLVTDRELLMRVLTNMIVNALEAIRPGETVRVWHTFDTMRPGFHVHNPGVIPKEVAEQMFQRSFSTKGGSGRGLGTYGMKLLGEEHLGGTLSFVSTEEAGTCFSIILPRS